MPSFSRILLIALLAAVSGMGHVPALVHLASCCDETELIAQSCDDCCCEHETQSEPEPNLEQEHHDSEDCRICQSLFLLPEASSNSFELGTLEPIVEFNNDLTCQLCYKTILSLAHPRGPPA